MRLGHRVFDNSNLVNYELKKWHHDINKPLSFGIHKHKSSKPRNYIDEVIKAKKIIPSPGAYELSKTLLLPTNALYAKSPRITVAMEIEKQ